MRASYSRECRLYRVCRLQRRAPLRVEPTVTGLSGERLGRMRSAIRTGRGIVC
jgi:hypothetical protein